ncbi:MAG: uroporphyrinogen decarboxylase family protein [Phycisphaeraceae bacterium]
MLNEQGYTFEDAAHDPRVHVEVALQWQHHLRTELNRYSDEPVGLPDVWDVQMHVYNVYEAAYFGAPVQFTPGQVPATEPIFTADDHQAIYEIGIDRPLEHGYLQQMLAFWHEMESVCRGLRFHNRPVRLIPWAARGSDGPVTVACNLCGSDFLMLMLEDPPVADRLLAFITDAAIHRRDAFSNYWGDRLSPANGLADDACAMLSPHTFAEQVLPHHLRYYEAGPPHVPRSMHLCGNATHLFPLLHQQADVASFDTGFPVDHGKLRSTLGPEVEILGGPQIDLLMHAAPDTVYARTREILQSGVMQGGRFILREGNNLPPSCPTANLEAMYTACLTYGCYAPDEPQPAELTGEQSSSAEGTAE